MKIDPENRVVTLGVRELAAFEIGHRSGGRPAGLWRTESGRLWHQTVQTESRSDFASERPISGQLERAGWTLRLEGRCDLSRERADGSSILGEIKTVTDPLPLPAGELRARFPSYFRQIALYLILAGQRNDFEESFLLFLNIDTGIRQKVLCGEEDFTDLDRHLDEVAAYLAFARERQSGRAELSWGSFRAHPREGQVEASDALEEAEGSHRIVGFQAPTGFGKTRIVLEHALTALRAGKADRILYLTGKTSGQEQVCAEIENLFPAADDLRSYRMRNHAEHWSACPLDGCSRDQCAPPDDEVAPVSIRDLAGNSGQPQEAWQAVQENAERERLCPYALSRAMLSLSDLWIGDYNYLFSPTSQHVFADQPDFDPSRTWLLIDEAHNLSDRVTAALGGSLDSRILLNASEDLRARAPGGTLPSILRELAREIDRLPTGQPAASADLFLFTDLFEAASEAIARQAIPWRDLPGETVATLQSIESALFLLGKEEVDPLVWSPTAGRLEWLPLQPGPWIAETLRGFAQTVFFSATLEPFDSFVSHFGLFPEQTRLVRSEVPGPGRFRTAIDARVRTALRERKRNAAKTAETLLQLTERARGCVAAFFPSFEYAESIQVYLEATAPHLRSIVQPRDLDAAGRADFALEAPRSHDVLFLMLGGSFAEAIDSFGGVIDTAMIVGPALPELSALNQIRIDRYGDREEGFHQVCRIPGMRRVNQAIGRLVRSLEHHATIVLHDSRFLESKYRDLLRSDLGEIAILRSDKDWRSWVESVE